MRILALDTSTPVTTCALCEDERVLWEKGIGPPLKAGDVLPAALGDLEGVDAIAVGLGPGSFTGLRVGLAAAKAIAYARRLPLAGASSLQAIALGHPGRVWAATEARKNELFVQQFEGGRPLGDVQVVMAADFKEPVLLEAPPARNVARLCLEKLRGTAYDAAVCFALAPDYVQGFPLRASR